MIFEYGEYKFIVPLDPSEGGRYVEPTTTNFITEDVNQMYRTTAHEEDYINPTVDGMLSWIGHTSHTKRGGGELVCGLLQLFLSQVSSYFKT
jgi:hypothetical protein